MQSFAKALQNAARPQSNHIKPLLNLCKSMLICFIKNVFKNLFKLIIREEFNLLSNFDKFD